MMVITNAVTQSKAKFHKSHHLHQRINVTHDDGDDDDNDDFLSILSPRTVLTSCTNEPSLFFY